MLVSRAALLIFFYSVIMYVVVMFLMSAKVSVSSS